MINDILDKKSLDALLIISPENRRYLSGFTGSAGWLLLTKSHKYIIVDGRYTIQAKLQAEGFEVINMQGSFFESLAKIAPEKIGIEAKSILYFDYLRLKTTLKNCKFVDISDYVNNLRMVKNEDEKKCIKKAENIGDMAFSHILNYIKPGVSEKDIALELEYFMKKNGADGLSFDTIVAFGKRTALPHAYPTDSKLKNGDFVLMDYGCIYNGYCSDMTRTVVCGKATDRQKEIYNMVLNAQKYGIFAIKEGIKGNIPDLKAREYFAEKGYDKYFTHSLGHGVGILIHELPNLSPKSDLILKENMIVTVEPGLYIENEFGIRIEDLVCVTKNGCDDYTSSEKTLIEL